MKRHFFIPIILIIIALATSSNLQAQKDKRYIRAGNKLYDNKKFDEAELSYRKAIEINDNNLKADFNLADALYKKESYSEAAGKFEYLASKTKDPKILGDISYNLGNSYFMQAKAASESGDPQQLQSSMSHLKNALEAYKKALRQNPKDNDARYNYELTRQLLQQQQEQQKKNDQNKDDKNKDDQNKDKQDQNKDGQDKDKQDQNKDGQNKDKQDQNKDGQNKDDQNKDKQDQQQPQKGKQQKMSKEDAEKMLKAMQQKEKATMKKMKQQKGSKVKIEKNW